MNAARFEGGSPKFIPRDGFYGDVVIHGWSPVWESGRVPFMHLSAKTCGTVFPIYSTSLHPSAVRGPVPYFKCSRAEGVRSLTAVWQPSMKPLNG